MSHRSKVRSGKRRGLPLNRAAAHTRTGNPAGSSDSRAPAYAGEPLPVGEHQAALAAMVQADREEACVRYLGGEATVAGLCGLMRETAEAWDQLLAQLEFDPPMACGPGCDACCYNPISLTPPEALFLGFRILERAEPGFLDEIDRRTDAVLVHMQGKSRPELALVRHLLPCPLLDQGACSTHMARPLVCRGWNGVDPEQCRKSLADRDPQAMIENHPLPRLLADHFQLGLLGGTHGLGLEAGYLALPRALRLLLDHGVEACARDWLRGEPFFGRKRRW